MNKSIFNAYSAVYGTAMMHDIKPAAFVAIANKANESRFSKLVKLFNRA